MKNILCLTIAWLTVSLAACASGNSSTAENPSGAASVLSAAKGGADVKDVCKILPKETVEKIAGEAVASAELSTVYDGAANESASFSLCTYKFSGSRQIQFFARRSLEDENTHEAVARLRGEIGAMPNAKIEDAPQLAANRAFWVNGVKIFKSQMSQLHFFKGGDVYAYIYLTDFADEAAAEAQAIKIAQAALPAL